MTVIELVLFGLLLWALREIIIGLLTWRKEREFRQLLRIEQTQRQFAEARNQLMKLAVDGEIDSRSDSFRNIYYLDTFIMRWPDEYQQISAALSMTILNPTEKTEPRSALVEESKRWSNSMRAVVVRTAEALDYLIVEHSFLLRVLYGLDRLLEPTLTRHTWLHRFTRKIKEAKESKDPVVAKIRKTQKRMHNLCMV